MAKPVILACPQDVWTKVNPLGGINNGVLYIKDTKADYFQTYRNTGGGAPANDLATLNLEGQRLESNGALIQSIDSIDVYVYCTKAAGKLRVDLPD